VPVLTDGEVVRACRDEGRGRIDAPLVQDRVNGDGEEGGECCDKRLVGFEDGFRWGCHGGHEELLKVFWTHANDLIGELMRLNSLFGSKFSLSLVVSGLFVGWLKI